MCRLYALLFSALLVVACAPRPKVNYEDARDIAMEQLRSIQVRSIVERREYCGWIYVIDGRLVPSQIVPGKYDRCKMPKPPRGARIVASFHTHGNHSPLYLSEIPSDLDVKGEISMGTYGFVSTPGGRVWVTDPFNERIVEVCGEGCLPQDPNYRSSDYGKIPRVMKAETIFNFFR